MKYLVFSAFIAIMLGSCTSKKVEEPIHETPIDTMIIIGDPVDSLICETIS